MLLGQSILLILAAALFSVSAHATSCLQPWMLFDTGDTLVIVPEDYKNMHNEPGLEGYLKQLEAANFPLGLIINVPEDWGQEIPVDDLLTRKVLYTQQFFREGWLGDAPDFPWGRFGKIEGQGKDRRFHGHVFFPAKNSDRKPGTCPTCTLNLAFDAAKKAGCPAIYQGEDAAEMEAAEKVGLIPFQVGHTDPAEFFLRSEKILNYLKNYRPGQWKLGIKAR